MPLGCMRSQKNFRVIFLVSKIGTFGKSDRFRTKKNGTLSGQIIILTSYNPMAWVVKRTKLNSKKGVMWDTLVLLNGLLRSIAHFHKKLPRLVHKLDIYVLLLLMIVDEPGCRQVSWQEVIMLVECFVDCGCISGTFYSLLMSLWW